MRRDVTAFLGVELKVAASSSPWRMAGSPIWIAGDRVPATGRNLRGSASDRRRRREWLVECQGIPRRKDGRKTRVRCFHCGRAVRADKFEVDRFPVCGHDGGRYVRSNVVASCKRCNAGRCHNKRCRQTAPQLV